MKNPAMVFVLSFLLPMVSAAQQVTWTPLLLPISPSSVNGALGSMWVTNFHLANEDDTPLPLFCFSSGISNPCSSLGPNEYRRVVGPPLPGAFPGLMYVPDGADVSAALRTSNETAGSSEANFTVEIPVVRESELYSEPFSILGVPVVSGYRLALRVYDVAAREGGEVRARFIGANGAQLSEVRMTLRTRRGGPSPFALPDEPAFAELLNLDVAPAATLFPAEIRVVIEPLTPGMKVWAMVTSTHNTTQRFSAFTPDAATSGGN